MLLKYFRNLLKLKLFNKKLSSDDLQYEQPLNASILFSLAGIKCIVSNQWSTTLTENSNKFHSIFNGNFNSFFLIFNCN